MIPIVLHHGFGPGNIGLGPFQRPYFRGVREMVRARGRQVIVTRVHPTASIARRAWQLKEQLLPMLDKAGADRAVIVAHSMGGLDARYMITRLGMSDRVCALITIATPHRGTAYAQWWKTRLQTLGAFDWGRAIGWDLDAIDNLTPDHCEAFNQAVPDIPGVKYFSVGTARPRHRVPAFAMHSHKVVQDAEGDNDGLVSVRSARWGHDLGVWPADHWHAINWRYVIEFKSPTGDILPYYRTMLDRVDADLTQATAPGELEHDWSERDEFVREASAHAVFGPDRMRGSAIAGHWRGNQNLPDMRNERAS